MIFRSRDSGSFMVPCIHMLFKSIFDVMSLIYSPQYHQTDIYYIILTLMIFYINWYMYLYLYKLMSLVSQCNIFNCIFVQWYIFGYYCFILECMVGYYGYKCNISCDGCLSDSCDSEYGICTDVSGCKPGWQPRQAKCDIGILIKK